MAWQRASDKAGIARAGVPFLTSEVDEENLDVIRSVCSHAGAPLTQIGQREVAALDAKLAQQFPAGIPEDSLLSAPYQRWNASLALAAIRQLAPHAEQQALLAAFHDARLLGRLWRVEEDIYADIAHNADKIQALSHVLEERFADRGRILVVGLSGRRLPLEVFPALARVAKTILVTGASFKGQDPGEVRTQIDALGIEVPTLVISEPRQALEVARSLKQANDVVILTGSTYMIEQVLNQDPYMRHLSATFGWRMEKKSEARGTVEITLPAGPSVVR